MCYLNYYPTKKKTQKQNTEIIIYFYIYNNIIRNLYL